jgi:hypothetical protein
MAQLLDEAEKEIFAINGEHVKTESGFGVVIERLEISIDKILVAIELAQEAFQRTAVQSALRIPGVLQTK